MAEIRPWSMGDVIDAVFFAIAALATLWLAVVVLGSGWSWSPRFVVSALFFWAVLAYLALPRMHQVLTWLYVPDYFIGRTRTADGLLGDPVNLALRGEEEDIHEAMTAAGWVRADPITLRSSWGIIVSSLMRRSYPAAPVSDLMLFGRKQDFAYQKEVEGNPAQRHHIRFWRTPDNWVLPGGQQVDWLAGATYDRAVGFSALTFQITHKIDADIDIERDYVVDDVRWSSSEARLEIWEDYFTAYHDKNGGGDRIITDGDLYILDVNDVVPAAQGPSGQDRLQQARQEEAGARRLRPPALVGAIALLVLLELNSLATFFLGGEFTQAIQQVKASQGGRIGQIVGEFTIIATVFIMCAIVVLAVATWLGHPRCRIALMMLITLSITTTMTQILSVGVSHASWGLVVSTALSVLALLAMSARSCQQWERARQAERQEARVLH